MPGCGKIAMSGVCPDSMATEICVSKSREPANSTLTPVRSSSGSKAAWKPSASTRDLGAADA